MLFLDNDSGSDCRFLASLENIFFSVPVFEVGGGGGSLIDPSWGAANVFDFCMGNIGGIIGRRTFLLANEKDFISEMVSALSW